MTSPFDVLGVSRSASKEEVKHAYRKLCLKHHPDLCAPGERAEAERVFKHLTEAYSRALAGDNYRSPGATRPRSTYNWGAPPRRGSNGIVALAFCLPLALAGMHMALQGGRPAGDGTRPHGVLQPPVNPFIADRWKPRQWSHTRH